MSSKDWRGRLLGFPYFDLPRWNHQLHFYPFVLELLKMTVVYGSCLFDFSVNSISYKKPKCTSSDFQEHVNWSTGQVHLGV